ncbi:hypothetical protein Syun_014532 [Stephania yunnanensis]|uniref:Epidermal patterning factor-like protein n=1 Tax=Stephania yunnanensis TaxID=152371 RepID=A0AAP0P8V6_9MAGN
MGFFRRFICSLIHHNLMIYFILLCSWSQVKLTVQGRALIDHRLSKPSKVGLVGGLIVMRDEEKFVVVRSHRIGSSPPRCERMCSKCGHCEAVQVPVVPREKTKTNKHYLSKITSSRDQHGYDYKPMRWQCKCGDIFYNP